MRERHGTATAFVDATPEAVFDFITDVPEPKAWYLPGWNGRCSADVLDRDALRFAYRSADEVRWTWQIVAVDGGTQIAVTWHGPIRRRPRLRKEVPASLDAILQHLSRRSLH